MGCSSVCEKNKDESGGGKLKKITFKHSWSKLFWLEIFALNFVEKNLLKGLEKLAQKHSPNLVENSAQTPKFIGLEKLAVGGLTDLSVDRPVDRQRSNFWPLELRSTGPVDRTSGTESTALCRSTARSTGAFPESRPLWTVDRVGDRPSSQNRRARLCTSVDRSRRPTSAPVDLVGRLVDWLKPGIENLGIKTWSFWMK